MDGAGGDGRDDDAETYVAEGVVVAAAAAAAAAPCRPTVAKPPIA